MNVKNTTTVSRVSGIPVDIDAAEVAQRHSRLFITDISKSDSTGNTAMSELVNDPTSSKSSPDSSNLTPKSAVSVIISRPDLKAIVSQDPTLRSLITTHKQTTDIKNFLPTSTVKSATTSFSSTSSTLRNTSSNLVTNPTISSTIKPEGSLNNSLLLPTIQKTRPDIPLLVGGGLALFIISLLIAIVVMLVRLKNRKGEDNISVRHGKMFFIFITEFDLNNIFPLFVKLQATTGTRKRVWTKTSKLKESVSSLPLNELKGNGFLSGETTLSKNSLIVFPSFRKQVYFYRKEFAPTGSNFFPLRVYPWEQILFFMNMTFFRRDLSAQENK